MGYLLKEALKTLCGVNQWSYAVFWKIGCQNPKLLIWEECYYGPATFSKAPGISGNRNPEIAFQDHNASSVSTETLYNVHLLVNKMMMDNHVNIVGEGLVGRVAFTGNHQWILSENYYREAHPPEVLKEVCQQFSGGMEAITVIPVLPHGVVQFGSYLTIPENIGFVNDVVSLILQLGSVPGGLQSEVYAAKYLGPIEVPVCSGVESNMINSSSYVFDGQTPLPLAGEMHNDMQQSNFAAFQAQDLSPSHLKPHEKFEFSSPNQFMNGVAKAQVIPSNSSMWTSSDLISNSNDESIRFLSVEANELSQGACSNINPLSGIDSLSDGNRGPGENTTPKYYPTSSGLKDLNSSKTEISFSDSVDHLMTNSLLAYYSSVEHHQMNKKFTQSEFNTSYDDALVQPQSGHDLFDVLGADFKNKLLSSGLNSSPSRKSSAFSEIYSSTQENPDREIFSFTGTDHLLDAVVSNVHPSSDDNISCKTTLTNISSTFASKASSLPHGQFGVSDHVKGELLGIPEYLANAGAMSSSFSQGSSIYDSWIERGSNSKENNSFTTGYSNKSHETSKTKRKRLKPGENPKPRPKDRQMIQDRVKELREIVPNGAKCSIDALLERTIKHMLFLQGVTKHADKLKQTVESKIISKDGGMLLKDNPGGAGATWAYEVGSQSMLCPIIVEDLNQPHQMLVEMLCEERGLFLEIADIIRGLGLTILKGFMETRNDKIWGHFTVEANRNVTRMEIFMSLVRLVEQNTKNGVPQPESSSKVADDWRNK